MQLKRKTSATILTHDIYRGIFVHYCAADLNGK